MKRICVLAMVFLLFLTVSQALPEKPEHAAHRVEAAIWANGIIYDTILTPATFKSPPLHSVDILYNFDMSGLMGQRSIANAAQGDPNYNGGRWWVRMVVFTPLGKSIHDPDDDGTVNFELTSAAQVEAHAALGHFIIMETNIFFECPLLRHRN